MNLIGSIAKAESIGLKNRTACRALKKYVDELPGMPLQDLILDIKPVHNVGRGSYAAER
jgi:hypothetical protein